MQYYASSIAPKQALAPHFPIPPRPSTPPNELPAPTVMKLVQQSQARAQILAVAPIRFPILSDLRTDFS
jgi:hypothetical protein